MRNDDQCLAAVEPVDGIHDCRLGLVIECGSRLVENQYLRILEQCTGDTDTLPLTAGQTNAAFSDLCIKTFRKTPYVSIELCFLQRLPYLIVINVRIRIPECHILADCGIDHENGLRNITDVLQPGLVMVADFHTICQDFSLFRL